MFLLHCSGCGHDEGGRHLVGTDLLLSLHNTSDGPIAYVRCPNGHTVVIPYGREYLPPRPAWLDRHRDTAADIAPATAPEPAPCNAVA